MVLFLIFGIFAIILSAGVECGAPKLECVLNTECADGLACIRTRCVDPCPGACGLGAQCIVHKRIPECSCPRGTEGNPSIECRPSDNKIIQPAHDKIVQPSKDKYQYHGCELLPCGAFSHCHEINDEAVCGCLPGFIGNPPRCHPKCSGKFDCPKANIEPINLQPCETNICGASTECYMLKPQVVSCRCIAGYNVGPFQKCIEEKSND